MTQSICIRCGGIDFELRESELKVAATRLAFVQCASCGGVIGVVEIGRREHLPHPPETASRSGDDRYEVEL